MDHRPVPLWIYALIFIFAVWNPAALALQAASIVWTLWSRPAGVLVLLAARLVLTGVGVAAGMALWLRRPGAVPLAKLALMLFGIEAVARLAVGFDVVTPAPGTRLPLALAVIAHNGAWYLYLQLSRRVRAAYRLESHP